MNDVPKVTDSTATVMKKVASMTASDPLPDHLVGCSLHRSHRGRCLADYREKDSDD